jgi:hypothetical protein
MDNKLKVLIGLAATTVVVAFVVTPRFASADASKQTSKFWNRQAHLDFWKKLFKK